MMGGSPSTHLLGTNGDVEAIVIVFCAKHGYTDPRDSPPISLSIHWCAVGHCACD